MGPVNVRTLSQYASGNPAESSTCGRGTHVSPLVRATLDRIRQQRPGIGALPLFPDLKDPTVAIPKHKPEDWLRQAEKLAGLEKQDGSLWHAFRRGWATARKHLPAADVAKVGGWKQGSVTLLEVYQQPDADTTLAVVLAEARA